MRYSDWEARLAQHIDTIRNKPFRWGEHDCALMAADCAMVICGKDFAADFRGKYTTEEEAYALILEYAGGGLNEMADKIADGFSLFEIGKNFAQRGDIVLCEDDGRDTLGIVSLSGRGILLPSKDGMVMRSIDCVKRAWRVE
jgi:hypothetical protein